MFFDQPKDRASDGLPIRCDPNRFGSLRMLSSVASIELLPPQDITISAIHLAAIDVARTQFKLPRSRRPRSPEI